MANVFIAGLTGRIGLAAITTARDLPDITITAGIVQRNQNGIPATHRKDFAHISWRPYGETLHFEPKIKKNLDVIIDCCHLSQDHIKRIIDLATRLDKPLVCCSSGYTNRDQMELYNAALKLPIFYCNGLENALKERRVRRVDQKVAARYALGIAKLMAEKPRGPLYTLDDLWPKLPR